MTYNLNYVPHPFLLSYNANQSTPCFFPNRLLHGIKKRMNVCSYGLHQNCQASLSFPFSRTEAQYHGPAVYQVDVMGLEFRFKI